MTYETGETGKPRENGMKHRLMICEWLHRTRSLMTVIATTFIALRFKVVYRQLAYSPPKPQYTNSYLLI